MNLRHVADAHHLVIVEIRLLHDAAIDGDPLGQALAKAVDDVAFGLRHDVLRLEREPGVDRIPVVVDANLACLVVQGHFGHRRGIGPDHFAERKSERPSATFPPVIGHLDDFFDDVLRAGIVRQHGETEIDGVPALFAGQIVDEGLDRKDRIARADRPPRGETGRPSVHHMLGQLVRYAVMMRNARHDEHILALGLLQAARRRVGENGLAHHTVTPAGDVAILVQPDLDMLRHLRAQLAELNVIFATPDNLDGPFSGLGQQNRVGDVLGLRPAAEPAPEEKLVIAHLLRLDLGGLECRQRRPALGLAAGPHLDDPVMDPRSRVHRLHLGVIGVIGGVFPGYGLRRRFVGGYRIALLDERNACLCSVSSLLAELRDGLFAVVAAVPGLAPVDLERFLAGASRLDRHANYRDAIGQRHDVGNALDLAGRDVVDLHGLVALGRSPQHRGIDHAGNLHVHPELGRTVDLRRYVDARNVLPQYPEVPGFLEIRLGNLWQGLRRFRKSGDLAIGHLAARFGVHHDARTGGQFGNRYAPLGGGSVEQNPTRLGAREPQLVPVAHDRPAGDCDEETAEARIAVDLVVRRRLLDHYVGPVRVEFLGNNHRQGCHDALPHLDRRRHDRNGIVDADSDPGVYRRLARRGGGFAVPVGQPRRHRQTESQPARACHEPTTADAAFDKFGFFLDGHLISPPLRRAGSP